MSVQHEAKTTNDVEEEEEAVGRNLIEGQRSLALN